MCKQEAYAKRIKKYVLDLRKLDSMRILNLAPVLNLDRHAHKYYNVFFLFYIKHNFIQ